MSGEVANLSLCCFSVKLRKPVESEFDARRPGAVAPTANDASDLGQSDYTPSDVLRQEKAVHN